MSDEWHLSDVDLGRYSALAMRTFELASVESHLMACARCRAALPDNRPASPATGYGRDVAWDRIAERIDRSRFSRGVHRSVFRFSFASPELLATTLGLAAALVFVVGVVALSAQSRSVPVLLALAPLLPVCGAVLAYRPAADPVGAMASATPFASGRLPLIRAVYASSISFAAGVVATALVPDGRSTLILWLLPGLAFTAIVLAVGTWIDPSSAAFGLTVTWVGAVGLWAARRQVFDGEALRELLIDRPAVQATFLTAAVLGGLICVARRDSLPNWRTQ